MSPVARMERSEIRDFIGSIPDCAALHPGYEVFEGVDTRDIWREDALRASARA